MSREYVLKTPPSAEINLRINYAGELNEQQLAAVSATPGPALVLAGAGAGKTRTLIYRVAWLLEHRVRPRNILLLTFTNKAAREMMDRVSLLLEGPQPELWGGTFHSIGLRILRANARRIDYPADFTIADREDVKDLLAACITDSGIDVKETRFPKPEVLAEIYSMQVNTGRSLAQVISDEHPSFEPLLENITDIRKRFMDRKRRAGLMDFDDLLALWKGLLEKNDDLRIQYQGQFQWILVDEYQDTNHLQSSIIDLMSGPQGNVMVVGDDSQSIYSWRGADFTNILDFPKRHPNAQVFRIETNYRSTPEILALANASIRQNSRQFEKTLRPVRPTGPKPALVAALSSSEQAMFVAQRTLELRDEGVPLDRICVLYRSHFHALELQMELTRHNIPFLITSGIRFFEQAHIKDVAAHLKLLANPLDELAFKRLARMLPGIGGKGADKLWTIFRAHMEPRLADLPVYPGIPASDNDGSTDGTPPPPPTGPRASDFLPPVLGALTKAVPAKTAPHWASFATTVSQLTRPEVRDLPGRCIRHLIESGYKDFLESNYENPRNRLDELAQLANYADQFQSVSEFLTQLALQTNLEAEAAPREGEPDDERIRLSSVHQAKGLEFHAVFVIMLCDGLFPTHRSLDHPDAMEEERRLFYVAVTRAEQELYLCYPLIRAVQGTEGLQQASRFIGELPSNLIEEWNLRSAWSNPASPARRSTYNNAAKTRPTSSDSDHPDYESGEPDPF